ncbi:MAG: hypothetical protein ACLUB2_05590 [Butyricicoccus pullicaecorum]
MFRGYLGGAGAAILGMDGTTHCAPSQPDLPAAGFGIDVERIAETGSEADNRQVCDTIRTHD